VTLSGFTLGQNYIFKVKARNSFDFGDFSTPLNVLAAKTPERPSAPITLVSGTNVIVDWEEPEDNGSPIIGYRILLR
jgi:hypothetical protein